MVQKSGVHQLIIGSSSPLFPGSISTIPGAKNRSSCSINMCEKLQFQGDSLGAPDLPLAASGVQRFPFDLVFLKVLWRVPGRPEAPYRNPGNENPRVVKEKTEAFFQQNPWKNQRGCKSVMQTKPRSREKKKMQKNCFGGFGVNIEIFSNLLLDFGVENILNIEKKNKEKPPSIDEKN